MVALRIMEIIIWQIVFFFDNSCSQIEHSNASTLCSLQGTRWIFIYSVGQI